MRLKAGTGVGVKAKLIDFNSYMVRLKGMGGTLDRDITLKFQFLHGAIKRMAITSLIQKDCLFQFLHGAIKSLK